MRKMTVLVDKALDNLLVEWPEIAVEETTIAGEIEGEIEILVIGEIAEQLAVGNDAVAEVVLDHHAVTEAVVMVAEMIEVHGVKKAVATGPTVKDVRMVVLATEMVIDTEVYY